MDQTCTSSYRKKISYLEVNLQGIKTCFKNEYGTEEKIVNSIRFIYKNNADIPDKFRFPKNKTIGKLPK